jgi:hypothetical protein
LRPRQRNRSFRSLRPDETPACQYQLKDPHSDLFPVGYAQYTSDRPRNVEIDFRQTSQGV